MVCLCSQLKIKLEESENKRKALYEKSLIIEKEYEEKLTQQSAVLSQKHSVKVRSLESVVVEQSSRIEDLQNDLKSKESEYNRLKAQLKQVNSQLDDIDNGDEHAILRKQLDILLKEKTSLCLENSELKVKLAKYEPPADYSMPSKRNQRVSGAPSKSPKLKSETVGQLVPLTKSIEYQSQPANQEDAEFRNKVMNYFNKKYPDIPVTYVSKSNI